MTGVMGRGACSRETQEWGRENWAMDGCGDMEMVGVRDDIRNKKIH